MKVPSAWSKPMLAKVDKQKIESRIDMSADVAGKGLCPECKKPMESVFVNNSRMLACAACRITLPAPHVEK